MVYERGTIVLVNYNPQKRADEVGKVRPAIIVSDTMINDVLDLVSVIALSTNLIDDAEPLRCVSKSRIGEILGRLNHDEMVKIEHGIRMMLGLEVVS